MPGLLIHNAAEIATLAGGLRRGADQAEVGVIEEDGAVAVSTGASSRSARIADVHRRLTEMGIDPALAQAPRRAARHGHARAHRPHTHLLFAGTRQRSCRLRQRGATTWRSWPPAAASSRPCERRARPARRSCSPTGAAGLTRCCQPRCHHDRGEVRLRPDAEHELRLLDVAAELRDEGPVELVPTFLGAHADAARVPDDRRRG